MAALLLVGFVATRLLVWRAETDYPAIGRFVRAGELRQHVLERGTGPAVVFLHGAFGGLQDFAATVLDRAAQRFRCIAWDRPGHGYSERPQGIADPGVQAEILVDLLDALAVERATLVGFSYGGSVALAAALAAPERIGGVVMLNGPTHPWPGGVAAVMELPAVPVAGPLLSETVMMPLGSVLAPHRVSNAFDPLPVPDVFRSSPVALSLRPGSYRANAEDVRTLKPFLARQRPRYPELEVPIRMVVSEGDRIVSPTHHSEQLRAEAKNVQVIRVPDAGHQILYTHPDLVLDAIDQLVRGD